MSILPNILSLLIAGYTVLLTFFWSDFGKNIRKYDHGRNLQKNILSSYAAAVCIMIFSLLVNFIFDAVIHLEVELPITISKWINGASIFSITILFFYPFWILKDTIINLYNLGQLSSFFDDNQKTYP
jgi:hypothetical protein